MDIIQKEIQYHLTLIEESIRKADLGYILQKGNQKSEKSVLKSAEVENKWAKRFNMDGNCPSQLTPSSTTNMRVSYQ